MSKNTFLLFFIGFLSVCMTGALFLHLIKGAIADLKKINKYYSRQYCLKLL